MRSNASTVSTALVIGLGASGVAAVEVLRDAGVTVHATDTDPDADGLEHARAAGAAVVTHAAALRTVDDVDLVVTSPGVPPHSELLRRASETAVPIWSEPELGWRLHLEGRDVVVVGVTGTNGKTSVTELITTMLRASGRDAVACGNIGLPFSEAAAAARSGQTLVAELSSFQLHFCHRLRPHVAVLTNVADDHGDWHGSAAAYAAAKARLWQVQRADDVLVVCVDDEGATALTRAVTGAVIEASGRRHTALGVGVELDALVAHLPAHDGTLLRVEDLRRGALHHVANVAVGAAAALALGAAPEAVAEQAATFEPGRHRVERVATTGTVAWVDDSKATNVHAAIASLEAFESIVWIAGGQAKQAELARLGAHLGAVRHAVVLGEAAPTLAGICASAGVGVQRVDSMSEAVARSSEVARPGDTVLLAPACASFDMFRDYRDRGDRFAAAARSLPGAVTVTPPRHHGEG